MIRSKSLGLILAAAATSPLSAATITFDDVSLSGVNSIYTSVTSAGYDFNGGHFHLINNPAFSGTVGDGTVHLGAEAVPGFGQPVTFTKAGGGAFSLQKADIAEFWLPGNSLDNFASVMFTGNLSGGGVLSQTFTLDGIRDGNGGVADFQTVTFSGWTNLV